MFYEGPGKDAGAGEVPRIAVDSSVHMDVLVFVGWDRFAMLSSRSGAPFCSCPEGCDSISIPNPPASGSMRLLLCDLGASAPPMSMAAARARVASLSASPILPTSSRSELECAALAEASVRCPKSFGRQWVRQRPRKPAGPHASHGRQQQQQHRSVRTTRDSGHVK